MVNKKFSLSNHRLLFFRIIIILAVVIVTGKLFLLQVLSHNFYSALASGQHGIFENLFPSRGSVYVSDPHSQTGKFPAAVNKNLSIVFVNTHEVQDPKDLAKRLASILAMDETTLFAKLNGPLVPYKMLKHKVTDE